MKLQIQASISATGTVRWILEGKDISTGELTDLLVPNTDPPNGEGWVSFTIKPKQNISSNTQIRNKATIVFDKNDPIDTPEVFNTIDSSLPTSSVTALSEYQHASNFNVNWSGRDDDGGSGIRDYAIYVSDNGGTYTLWTTIAGTSSVFSGQDEHSYRFYSIARDNVGNIESAPGIPDATTTVTVTMMQEGIAVSPSPYVPARGHTVISFFGTGLPYAKINIYNKAAELVQTLEEKEGKTQLDWDATSEDGKKLASGVYMWVSTDKDGKHRKGKFAIIR